MLVLSRLRDEDVVLTDREGQQVGRVKVVGIRGDMVRLGFTFPREVEIDRAELYEAKQLEDASDEY
ncbi:MAG: carbon storage regulator [Planctomycetota bacterium]